MSQLTADQMELMRMSVPIIRKIAGDADEAGFWRHADDIDGNVVYNCVRFFSLIAASDGKLAIDEHRFFNEAFGVNFEQEQVFRLVKTHLHERETVDELFTELPLYFGAIADMDVARGTSLSHFVIKVLDNLGSGLVFTDGHCDEAEIANLNR